MWTPTMLQINEKVTQTLDSALYHYKQVWDPLHKILRIITQAGGYIKTKAEKYTYICNALYM